MAYNELIITIVGSIAFAFLGGYWGLDAGGVLGAICFTVLGFFFGLIVTQSGIKEVKENYLKFIFQLLCVIILWILGNYVVKIYL